MGRPILLLRLEGPLQSWGARSRWDVRDTQPEPTKSGIIGVLACALGYPVGDPRISSDLDAGLRFGVRVENPGAILQDYQTVTDFLPSADGRYRHTGVSMAARLDSLVDNPDVRPATIISPRYYLEDAAFLVALEERDGFSGLTVLCASALRQPVWPLYLGRKACVPTRPVLETLTEEYDDLETALTQSPWSWLGAGCRLRTRDLPTQLRVLIEPAGSGPGGDIYRRDAIRPGMLRQYGLRAERELGAVIRTSLSGETEANSDPS